VPRLVISACAAALADVLVPLVLELAVPEVAELVLDVVVPVPAVLGVVDETDVTMSVNLSFKSYRQLFQKLESFQVIEQIQL
jgi:hypothetical protein